MCILGFGNDWKCVSVWCGVCAYMHVIGSVLVRTMSSVPPCGDPRVYSHHLG